MLGGFDLRGCSEVRVVGYTLGGGSRTDLVSCELEIVYDDGDVAEVSVEVEMNLASFQAMIRSLNDELRRQAD